MHTVTLRFTSKWPYNPGSLLIARATGSRDFSHVFSIIDGVAYEATMFHGCRVVPVSEAMKGVVRYQDMIVPVRDIKACKAFGMAQDGHDYDYAGAFGLPFLMSDDWQDDSSWWCSEHAFKLLWEGGALLLDPGEFKRVTPNDLYQCNYKKLPMLKLAA